MSSRADVIKAHLLTLLEDYKDFNSTPISTQPVPTAVEFAKQVSNGYPCVYRAYDKVLDRSGKFQVWTDPSLLQCPAFLWTKQDLINLVDDKIEVAVTPNGRADDLHNVDGNDEQVFLLPANVEMTIAELLAKLNQGQVGSDGPGLVHYLQSQNSNLTTTPLARILKHIPKKFPFAEPVLSDPEAINIWIGDESSITSTHRDPYENLYLVLKGSKIFTLYPPVDEITLPTKFVRSGHYEYNTKTNAFAVVLDESDDAAEPPSRIPWISIDPLQPREELIDKDPLYARSSPRTVKVNEGEILYLPSGWYHHVQQECGTWDEDGSRAPCIAVNYWFDMEYAGEKYVMRQLVSRLVTEMRSEALGNGE